MKRFIIYRNNELKLLNIFSIENEEFKLNTGCFSIMGFLIFLLGEDDTLSKKFIKGENFILNKEEKSRLSNVLENYIDPKINNFRNANEDDIYCKVVYKEKNYLYEVKSPEYRFEQDLGRAMSLHKKFYDPKDNDVVEIRFDARDVT